MAAERKVSSLRTVDTEDLVEELNRRMGFEGEDAYNFRDKVLQQCGYEPVVSYIPPEKKNTGKPSSASFFRE
jgi:hypothetical protein